VRGGGGSISLIQPDDLSVPYRDPEATSLPFRVRNIQCRHKNDVGCIEKGKAVSSGNPIPNNHNDKQVALP
jgi:hypothetical protein